MKERRLAPRAKIDCRITVISDYKILVFNTEAENIGEGGIRVFLKERLNPKTRLDMEIFPPDKGLPLKCKGELIWMNEKVLGRNEHIFDTGIKFVDITGEQKDRLKIWQPR